MTTALPPLVILGGDLSALSVARAAGRRGIDVYALSDARSHAPVRTSRFLADFADFTGLRDAEDAWAQRLQTVPAGSAVLPCSDEGLEFLARHHVRLAERGLVPVRADWAAVLAMLDKAATYQIATQAGIECPRHVVATSREDVERAAGEFAYPCAIKPLQSHVFRQHFPLKLLTAETPDELVAGYRKAAAAGVAVMVTEMISDGADEYCSYYTYLDDDGQPLVHFTKRKLRQWPVGRGIGTYHVTRWDPEVAELGLRFARGAGLRGLVNVEFKRDGRDGRLKLIECNPRITAANELVRRAGIDFGGIAYDVALGRTPVLPSTFREDLHQWLPLSDFRAYRAYRTQGTLSTWQWLRSLLHRQSIPLFALDDPMPAISRVHHRTAAPARPSAGLAETG